MESALSHTQHLKFLPKFQPGQGGVLQEERLQPELSHPEKTTEAPSREVQKGAVTSTHAAFFMSKGCLPLLFLHGAGTAGSSG